MKYKPFQARYRKRAILAVLLLFGFLVSQSSHAKIVFASKRKDAGDTAYHIYVMEDNGSNVRRITDPAFYDVNPHWFPDGQRVVFERDLSRGDGTHFWTEFVIVDLKPREEYHFMENHRTDMFPRISPDGKRLAFYSNRLKDWHIHVADLESGAETAITVKHADLGFPSYMNWSPDGKQLVYLHGENEVGEQIWIMNADGSRPKRLSHPVAGGINRVLRYPPSWSPSGQFIMYSEVTLTPNFDKVGPTRLIFQNVRTRQTDIHNFPRDYAINNGCWINDRIVLLNIKTGAGGIDPEANWEIYRYDLTSRTLRNLTKDPANDYEPDWISGTLAVFPLDKLTIRWAHLKQPD
ncbi:hypothetical protein C6501_15895 [Candidatus Poribacteria bacterium]|nr:MAG: hypothetical protein C6501_15895 [Candidatus Poribacteria bacterium]